MVSLCLPSRNTCHLSCVSLTLDVGSLFTAAPAKHKRGTRKEFKKILILFFLTFLLSQSLNFYHFVFSRKSFVLGVFFFKLFLKYWVSIAYLSSPSTSFIDSIQNSQASSRFKSNAFQNSLLKPFVGGGGD